VGYVISGLVLALALALPAPAAEGTTAQEPAAGPVLHPPAPPDLRRAAALLDYVCGDYHRAVSRRGRVRAPDELEEHRRFVREAVRELEQKAPEEGRGLRARLLDAEARMSRGAPPSEVVPLLRAARAELVERFHLAALPAAPPDLARAKGLYDTLCARCHGAAGAPPASEQLGLPVAPRAFASPREVRELSPQRAFGAITFGAGGEGAMPSWAEGLVERDRWSLASYVLTFARPLAAGEADAGLALAARAGLPTDYARLSALTNRDLEEALASAGSGPAEVDRAIAALRGAPEQAARATGLWRHWPLGLACALVLATLLAVAAAKGRRVRREDLP
jgi:mono/diheme cytochrome c family protein